LIIILARYKLTLHFSIPLYTILTGRIYHTMQREKLYNLHKTTYFAVLLFVSRLDKILAIKLRLCEKDNFFDTWQTKLLLFQRCITKINYQKRNKIHHEMQREKLYNLHSKAYCNCFKKRKILCDQFLQCSKSGSSRLCIFWKQDVQLRNKLSCVDCRAFRAVSYSMFWSLIQYINERKVNLSHPL